MQDPTSSSDGLLKCCDLTFCCLEQNPGLVDQYISTLLSLDQSPTTLAMLGMCLDFCTAQKEKATIEKHKVSSSVLV